MSSPKSGSATYSCSSHSAKDLKVYLQGAYEKYERDVEGDRPPTGYQVITINGESWLKYSQVTDPELIP